MQDLTKISAKSWILLDYKKRSYIRGCNTQQQLEIASLTKMYTLYTCLALNKTFNISPERVYLKIFEPLVYGTMANLKVNEYISIEDLYYGLMLPSGNDAACILAFYYGFWLSRAKEAYYFGKNIRKEDICSDLKYFELYTKKFVQFMNNVIVKKQLNHKNTHFQNPHGLDHKYQTSNAWEVAQATILFLNNPAFAKISSSKYHSGTYYQSDHKFQWQNTNILLGQGYFGVKTGYTKAAGGCLSSLTEIKISKYEYQSLLIVVLGSDNSDKRFIDTKQIIHSYKIYLSMMKL